MKKSKSKFSKISAKNSLIPQSNSIAKNSKTILSVVAIIFFIVLLILFLAFNSNKIPLDKLSPANQQIPQPAPNPIPAQNPTDISKPQNQNSCSDSDGLNFFTKGTIVARINSKGFTTFDSCVNENILTENYCNGIEAKTLQKNCQEINQNSFCENGACVDVCLQNLQPIAILPDDISNWPVGKPLTIYSESTDSDGQIVLSSWNFGDGIIQETTEPSGFHIYNNTGFFTITLTVTDNCGAVSTDTMQIYSNLTADFFYFPSILMEDESVYFEAYAPPHLIYPNQYRWEFSNGGATYGKNITRLYPDSGNFQARLRIRNLSLYTIYSEWYPIEVLAEPQLHIVQILEGDIGEGFGILTSDGYVWVARAYGGDGQLVSVDARTLPAVVMETKHFGHPNGQIARKDNILAVASSYLGVRLYSINANGTLQPIGQYNTAPYQARGVQFVGNRLIVARETEIHVLDISNPNSPVVVNTLSGFAGNNELGWVSTPIVASEDYFYTGGVHQGPTGTLLTFRLLSDDTLEMLNITQLALSPFDLSLDNNLLAVTERTSSDPENQGYLAFFTLNNPNEPEIIFQSDLGYYKNVYLNQNKSYVTSRLDLIVFNISSPMQPTFIQSVPLGYYGTALTGDETGRIYVSLTYELMAILEK